MGHSHHPSSGGSPESIKAGHELTDVKVGPLLQFGVMMTVVVTLTMWGSLKFHTALEAYFATSADVRHPMQDGAAVPAGPRLQTSEAKDYAAFKAEITKQVEGDSAYAWVDRPADVVRVPIARAMELVLQQGLPHRPATK